MITNFIFIATTLCFAFLFFREKTKKQNDPTKTLFFAEKTTNIQDHIFLTKKNMDKYGLALCKKKSTLSILIKVNNVLFHFNIPFNKVRQMKNDDCLLHNIKKEIADQLFYTKQNEPN